MNLRQFTLNRKLAIVAVALGTLALLAQPHRGPFVKLDARELASVVEAEVDHVTAPELASWIVEGRADYPLLRNEKIVLYSEGGIHSAQAWMLLRARGYEAVYMVLGGLDAWQDEVLFPALPADADARARAQFERAAQVAKFFGGEARSGNGAAAAAASVALPKLTAPPPMPGPATPVAKKKKKEGC
jgi:rhodanese-related sulfurtransferase